MSSPLTTALVQTLRPGATVALGDGAGAPRELEDGITVGAALSAAAWEVGSVRLVLGWLPTEPVGLDPEAFSEVIVLMPGWGLRKMIASRAATFVPTSLAGWPALLSGPLRPDVLLARVGSNDSMWQFGTEVSFQRGLVDAGVPMLGVVDDRVPDACALPPLCAQQVHVVAHASEGPASVRLREPEPIHEELADAVLRFVPEGARLQYGPGQLGTALLRRAKVPLHIDTGLLTDAVVDLDSRGLLLGTPSATYLVGSQELYDWVRGRPILRGIEYTHNVGRLSRGGPFVAVNTAIEIDPAGQINVEGFGDKVVGGIGGHPDYCAAGQMSRKGLSIIAVPTSVNSRSPLVIRLSRPTSTPAHNIDLIVTERGCADLRGTDWATRTRLITELFEH